VENSSLIVENFDAAKMPGQFSTNQTQQVAGLSNNLTRHAFVIVFQE